MHDFRRDLVVRRSLPPFFHIESKIGCGLGTYVGIIIMILSFRDLCLNMNVQGNNAFLQIVFDMTVLETH